MSLSPVTCVVTVVDVARGVQPVERRCRAIHSLVSVLHYMGTAVCCSGSCFGANVCTICMRFWYPWSEYYLV